MRDFVKTVEKLVKKDVRKLGKSCGKSWGKGFLELNLAFSLGKKSSFSRSFVWFYNKISTSQNRDYCGFSMFST